jgi:hypothetical protein
VDRGGKIMKKMLMAFAVAALVFLGGTFSLALAQDTAQSAPKDSVVVYYIHGGPRCPNCYNMENWTKELVEKDFKDQVDSGKLVFKAIDTDIKENEHYLKDYKLYTKAVVLSLVKGGVEVSYVNLTKVWDHLRSKEKFREYEKCEIEKLLKEI